MTGTCVSCAAKCGRGRQAAAPGTADGPYAAPARRLGTPSDVGGAVASLASDEAEWITGQTLVMNGGSYAF